MPNQQNTVKWHGKDFNIEQFSERLKCLANPTVVDIEFTPLTHEALKQVLSLLATYPIEVLRLVKCNLTDESALSLSEWLIDKQSIEEIDLRSNCFTSEGLTVLANIAPQLQALNMLNVAHNNNADANTINNIENEQQEVRRARLKLIHSFLFFNSPNNTTHLNQMVTDYLNLGTDYRFIVK